MIVGSLLVWSWMTLRGIIQLGFLELNLKLWRGKIQIQQYSAIQGWWFWRKLICSFIWKRKTSFSKTVFDLLSLKGLWHVFHGVNWWPGSLEEYRVEKNVREGKNEHAVFPMNLTESKEWSNGTGTIGTFFEDRQAGSENMLLHLWP